MRLGLVVECAAPFVTEEVRALRALGLDVRVASAFRPAKGWEQEFAGAVLYPHRGRLGWAARTLRAAPAAPRRLAWLGRRAHAEGAPLRLVALAAELAGRARAEGWHHVHGSFAGQPAFLAGAVAQLAGIGFSFTGHAYDVQHPGAWLPRLLDEARFARAISEETAQRLRALAPDAAARARIRVARLGVDVQRFAPHEAAAAEPPEILAVARLVPKKGLALLIDAAAELAARGWPFRLRLLGDGPLAGPLAARVRTHGLEDQVELAGAATPEAVRTALERAAIFALPCVVTAEGEHDGIPVALLEAMAAGLPVVTTPVGGIQEAVRAGTSGLLVPPGDSGALAGALARLLAEPAERARLGAAARCAVQAEFTLERSARRLARMLAAAPGAAARPRLESGGVLVTRPLRVLVLAYYFPPIGGGGVNRTLKWVRALAAAGHEPWVVTVDGAAWPHDRELAAAVPREARVWRLPNPDWGRVPARAGARPQAGRGAGRLRRLLVPDLHVGWSALAGALAAGFAATRAVDAVVSSAPPYSAHLAAWPAHALGLPWLADFRDAWTRYPGREGFPAWRRALEAQLEASVLTRADRVLFASDRVRRVHLARHPGLAERSETVLTGFDPQEFRAAAASEPPGDRLALVHAGGALRDEKAPTTQRLLAALVSLRRRSPVLAARLDVAFVGGESDLLPLIRAHGLGDCVRVEPALPRSELPARLGRAHRCLHLAPAGRRGGDNVPGKLFDAAGAGRRLLALTPRGACAALLDELDLGEWFAPESGEALVAHLAALAAEPSLRALGSGSAARQLSTEASARRVVAALEQACARAPRPAGEGVPCP